MDTQDLLFNGRRKEIQDSFKKEKKQVLFDEMSAELEDMIENSSLDSETKSILEFMHMMIKNAYQD